MRKFCLFPLLFSLLACLLSACTAPPVAGVAFRPTSTFPPAFDSVPATPLPPVVQFNTDPPTPSVDNGLPSPLITRTTAEPTSTPPSTPTETALTSTPTTTPTAIPTFTPPALPGTSNNEHYWFFRPVPEDETIWTDKVYPYGSTRGGTLRTHAGVEFNVPNGTPIFAAAAGTVVVAGDDSQTSYGEFLDFYGNLIVIEHETRYNGESVYTLYAHLSEVQVVPGQRVEALQQIALSGGTGIADGPHLHFEVRLGANSYASTRNPLLWLYPFEGSGTVTGRVIRPNGTLVDELQVSINRIDGPSRYRATTTYAADTVNPDSGWRENFALDDIPAGFYEVYVRTGGRRFKVETWVFEYQTSVIEINIQNPSE